MESGKKMAQNKTQCNNTIKNYNQLQLTIYI